MQPDQGKASYRGIKSYRESELVSLPRSAIPLEHWTDLFSSLDLQHIGDAHHA